MTIDLSFTQNPDWIKNRQDAWDKMEDSLAEGRTKKALEARKNYFFYGIPPKIQLYPVEYMQYFPAPSYEGLKFAIGSYIDAKNIEDRQYRSMQLAFSQNLEHWPGLSSDDRLRLFKLAHGETYDPERKFPFLIGNEETYRDFAYGADGYFSVMTSRFARCFGSDEVNNLFWLSPEITQYYLSIIPKVDSMIFSLSVTEEEKKKKVGSTNLEGTQSFLNTLIKFLLNSKECPRFQSHPIQAASAMETLITYMESDKCPKALNDRWQWAKKEFANE